MLFAARTVISNDQGLINDPRLGDKHLTGKAVLDDAVKIYVKATGVDPATLDPATRAGRLLHAMMAAIVEVVDANQPTLNEKGTGFKGFIPAVFARLVNEAFNRLAKGEAEAKATAPPDLVRNRKALPDPWEARIIATKLLDPGLVQGAGLRGRGRSQGAPGVSRHGARILFCLLSRLPRLAQGRNGHNRLSQRGRQARRFGRRVQRHPLSLIERHCRGRR